MPFPTSIYSHATLVDLVDSVLAAHQNTPNTELTTVETWLVNKAELAWIPVNETWIYASASTITAPTDATTKYQKWDRIRFKQGGGYKYFTLQSLTSTVLTIVTNTDHVVANSAITDVYISRSIKPFGYPSEFNFSAAIANFTATSATITARLAIANGLVTGHIEIVFGASTAITGALTLTLPVPIASYGALIPIGLTRFKDATGGNAAQGVILSGGQIAVFNGSGTYVIADTLSSTIPFTWATSDDMEINFSYFAA